MHGFGLLLLNQNNKLIFDVRISFFKRTIMLVAERKISKILDKDMESIIFFRKMAMKHSTPHKQASNFF
jgi:hypothetical protein